MTSHYTSKELIEAAKAYIAQDAALMAKRPAGMPRAAWRSENPIALPYSFAARDLSLKSRPQRSLSFDLTGNPYDLAVWGYGARRGWLVEHIDLRAPDADEKLRRYERV